ncbi:MAG TPA: acido-empty-quinoprotein group A [Gemmatimonadaceae bacterium]|nr:acido-empty-quinoprotein group A [Gemmatimonadaceae bacterium]
MIKTASLLLVLSFCVPRAPLPAQGLNPATLLEPATDSWPTYAGDYSQRRYSTLTQIDTTNVRHLTLAWVSRLTAGPGGGERGFFGPAGPATITGGVAENPVNIPGSTSGSPRLAGSILQVNGILYVSSADNAWAMDALDGHVLWHFWWKSRGGTHIGNRGMAMYGDWLYVETPDDYLVSLDAKTGHERWHKEISDFSQQYFSTMAPLVVGNHVLVGTGDDLDSPGFLQAFDPETGALQWKHYTVPMKQGDPGLETWASLDAARHGGAQVWMPGSYDPETHLYIFGTGNPTPAYTARVRGPGGETNLYTCSVVAVNVDTGEMAWYFQTSPADTHDWDATQPPVLVDGMFAGKPRKMVLQASRNGYFYVLDRTNGQHLLTMKYSDAANWADSINAKGQLVRNPEKDNTVPGSLVSPDNGGATNWYPPSYDPQSGLFYVTLREVYSMYYLTTTDPRAMVGLGGSEQDEVGSLGTYIAAINYQTGKLAWRYRFQGAGGGATGLLTTAGRLLFANDGAGNFVAFGLRGMQPPVPLWHAHIGSIDNAAETYTVGGHQYVLVTAEGSVYAFVLQ